MSEVNVPHRVLYKFSGNKTSRVFGSKNLAEDFAKDLPKNAEPIVQPASTPVESRNRKNSLMNSIRRTTTALCKCGSGRTKLISEEYCFSCSGALDQNLRTNR